MKHPRRWSEERRETLFTALLLELGPPPKKCKPDKNNGMFRWGDVKCAEYAIECDRFITQLIPELAGQLWGREMLGKKTRVGLIRNAFLRWYTNNVNTQLTHDMLKRDDPDQ